MQPHYFLVSFGSAGDVLPLISLGAELVRRGNHATLLAACVYKQDAALVGLTFIPISDEVTYDRRIRDTYLLSTRYSALFVTRYAIQWNERVYQGIANNAAPEKMIVAAEHPCLWAHDWLYQTHQILTLLVQIEPPPPPSLNCNKAVTSVGTTQASLAADMERRVVQSAKRCNVGIVPKQTYSTPKFRRIGLWSKWFVSGHQFENAAEECGFILPEPTTRTIPEDDLTIHGDYVVFVAGSRGTTRQWSSEFFDASANLCRLLACHGVLLGGHEPALKEENCSWMPSASLRSLLWSAQAIVHHGGIGTALCALETSTPQLVIPRAYGQHGTAEWLRRLRVAEVLEAREYRSRGEAMLRSVIANPTYRERSAMYSKLIDSNISRNRACDLIVERMSEWRKLNKPS